VFFVLLLDKPLDHVSPFVDRHPQGMFSGELHVIHKEEYLFEQVVGQL
jgi:hypothetical protein